MSIDTSEQFTTRVNAVFGVLNKLQQPSGHPGAAAQWSLARQQVYRAGKGDSDSSEGEETTAERPDQLVPSLLDVQDSNVQTDLQGNIIQPSLAFCHALDNEQEYDEVDAVAGTGLRALSDPSDCKPNRYTEVLDDNVFDQQMQPQSSAGLAVATLMETGDHTSSSSSHQQHQPMQCEKAAQAKHGRPPASRRTAGRHRGRSYVPHHVKHPEKYTCYILDEPLIVGGGDRASESAGSQLEQAQAARAASSAAQPKTQSQEPKEPLPAFGSGIQFRPTKKAKQQPTTQAPQKPVAASNLALQDEIEQESEDALMLPAAEPVAAEASCMDEDFGEGRHAVANKPKRRQYRVKAQIL